MVIKYVSRWEKKGGVQDLEKAIHCLQLLVEMKRGPRPDFAGMIDLVKKMPDLKFQPGGTCAAAWGGLGE
jgi:hypothetical protein